MANIKEHAVAVANEIMQQLYATTDINVIWSWGIRGYGAGWIYNDCELYCACLVLDVSGLIHKGRVIVALDEANDWYDVLLLNAKGERVGTWHKEIYCDMLGRKLDELIERPTGMTDEEYRHKYTADNIRKILEEK